jgi:hypothetical protein
MIKSGRAAVVLISLGAVGSGEVLLGAAENVAGHGGCSDREGRGAKEKKEEEETGSGDGGDSHHSLGWHCRHGMRTRRRGLRTRRLCPRLLPLCSLRCVSPYRMSRAGAVGRSHDRRSVNR